MPAKQPTVFISYAQEDLKAAKKLYLNLKKAGANPWLDKENLLPGQNWKDTIKREIKKCRYFIAVLSVNSVGKKGYVQNEVVEALDRIKEFPPSEIFIIPARLDECQPPPLAPKPAGLDSICSHAPLGRAKREALLPPD